MASKTEIHEGGCTCRHVRYRLKSKPMFVHCCHCRWCQRETGIQATDERFTFLIHGLYPLTQFDMNKAAGDAYLTARKELERTYEEVSQISDIDELKTVQDAWETYADLQSRLVSGVGKPGSGSIAPLIYSTTKDALTKARIKELTAMLQTDH